MVKIKEMTTPGEIREFVSFKFSLLGRNPFWAPPLIKEEESVFYQDRNPAFHQADARLFMAYENGEPKGRIAAIINWSEVKELEKPKIRFGWFDVVDEREVTQKLLQKVEQIGREEGLEYMEGPLGFSNLDKAGLLVKGFEELNTMITWYNLPYYQEHLEELGWEKNKEWVEFKIRIPEGGPSEKVRRFSNLIMERNNLHVVKFENKKQILQRTDEMFEMINDTYRDLSTFVPLHSKQIDYYKHRYIKYVHPDFISCVADENDRLVAFAITMPSFAKALQKANGRLLPFGWFHLLKARYFNDRAAFYLIGIRPEYQNKGITAAIFKEMNELFNRKGITEVETNPELEENKAVQALWNRYDSELHKRRRTYRKDIE